uniref:GIY-YIG domain-containing protein n=1 Tax=Amphimedon queenslandica TaxID=400682 RepID=A0A1X7VVS1_AMPQE
MANYSDECDGPSCQLCAEYGRESDNIQEETDGGSGTGFVVYLITSAKGVPYVGKTNNFKHRMSQHRYAIKDGRGDGRKFIEYYRNHDFDAATKEILDTAQNEEELEEMEHFYIAQYNSVNNGLNTKW